MPSFDDALEFVLRYEGGYVNDPNDPGGETNMGISKRAFPDEDIAGMTHQRAAFLYHTHYWTPCRCDDMPFHLAICVFDFAVNSGVKRASKTLQRLVSATPDGVIGPKTIEMIESVFAK